MTNYRTFLQNPNPAFFTLFVSEGRMNVITTDKVFFITATVYRCRICYRKGAGVGVKVIYRSTDTMLLSPDPSDGHDHLVPSLYALLMVEQCFMYGDGPLEHIVILLPFFQV